MPPQPKARASTKYRNVDPSDRHDRRSRRYVSSDSSSESDALKARTPPTKTKRYPKVDKRSRDALKARQSGFDSNTHKLGREEHDDPPPPPIDSRSVEESHPNSVSFGSKPQHGVPYTSSSQMVGEQPIPQKLEEADHGDARAPRTSKPDVGKQKKSSQQNAARDGPDDSLETARNCYICGDSIQIRRKRDWQYVQDQHKGPH